MKCKACCEIASHKVHKCNSNDPAVVILEDEDPQEDNNNSESQQKVVGSKRQAENTTKNDKRGVEITDRQAKGFVNHLKVQLPLPPS